MFLKGKVFRCIVSLIVFTLVYSVTLPVSKAFQSEPEVEESFLPEDFDEELDELVDILKEMNENEIDLVDIENNDDQIIEDLSSEAQELYLEYEKAVEIGEVAEIEAIIEEVQSEQDAIIETASVESNSTINFFGT